MNFLEIRVGGRFRVKKNIGHGSFGDIYIAQNVQTYEEVAVKIEDSRTKYPQLIYEAKILYGLQGGSGIPNLIWCGQEGDYNVLIMELLGESLESVFQLCNKRMSLKTVLMIVDQTLQLIEIIHNKGFLHRDIKPENLLMGFAKKSHLVHFIDYGLAKRYRDPKTAKHIPYREGKQLTGTARYASINTHKGYEQSRRDDLEALGYVYVYLFKGGLPWQGMKGDTKQDKYTAIYEKKVNTPLEELCSGMPREFIWFFEYCNKLRFDEKPDYSYLRRSFKELFLREGFEFDYIYDWILIPASQQINLNYNRLMIDVEFSQGDEFMNYNVCNIDKWDPTNDSPAKKDNVAVPQEQDDNNGAVKSPAVLSAGGAGGANKLKPKPKPIETEYLRTDYKLANIPSPVNLKSPNKVIPDIKEKEKKAAGGKDCNIF